MSGETIDEQWKDQKDIINMLEDEFIPHRMAGSGNRHKGKLPLDEASVRQIKKQIHSGKGIRRPMMECIIQNNVRLEIRFVK